MFLYVTFGQVHVHSISGRTFDKNCVARIPTNVVQPDPNDEKEYKKFQDEMCDLVEGFFGRVYATWYHDDDWKEEEFLDWYPRGYVDVK